MRSDASRSKRETDKIRLRAYIESKPKGHFFPILDWYEQMNKLGLGHSDRQRLSDLRADGLQMDFDKRKGGYVYQGFLKDGQLNLNLAA